MGAGRGRVCGEREGVWGEGEWVGRGRVGGGGGGWGEGECVGRGRVCKERESGWG